MLGRPRAHGLVVRASVISISVVAPSFQAADLIELLSIGTVAIGFAVQIIVQNFLGEDSLVVARAFPNGGSYQRDSVLRGCIRHPGNSDDSVPCVRKLAEKKSSKSSQISSPTSDSSRIPGLKKSKSIQHLRRF